ANTSWTSWTSTTSRDSHATPSPKESLKPEPPPSSRRQSGEYRQKVESLAGARDHRTPSRLGFKLAIRNALASGLKHDVLASKEPQQKRRWPEQPPAADGLGESRCQFPFLQRFKIGRASCRERG